MVSRGRHVLRLRGTRKNMEVISRVMHCLFILLLVISCVNALYFFIAETERKCFIEEIPDETLVVGE